MEWRCEWCGKPHEENDPPCDNCGHGAFERAVVPAGPEGEGGPTVWVCAECGRTHPRNNPPCSRCGAMTLEQREQTGEDLEAPGVEEDDDEGGLWSRLTGGDDEGHDGPETMTVWACTECGRTHPRNNPPCSRCGAMSFEQREIDFGEESDLDPTDLEEDERRWAEGGADEDAPDADGAASDADGEASAAEVAAAAAGDSTVAWVCTECGREHPRNNPPCSRCGNMTLERREQRFDDLAPSPGGWLDALDAKVALGFVGATALLAVLVASALGIITLPGMGPPTVPADEVPGNAESAGGLDLTTVEDEYVAELNERRTAAGSDGLSRIDPLDARATWYNRRVVQGVYTDTPGPSSAELRDVFESVDGCSDGIRYVTFSVAGADGADSETALAGQLVEAYVREYGGEYIPASDGSVGVDVHVGPDGTVFVTQFVC